MSYLTAAIAFGAAASTTTTATAAAAAAAATTTVTVTRVVIGRVGAITGLERRYFRMCQEYGIRNALTM
jgi:hypothetical protein